MRRHAVRRRTDHGAASHAPLISTRLAESRTARRRLLLYMSSISLGVAALVAIDSFASNTPAQRPRAGARAPRRRRLAHDAAPTHPRRRSLRARLAASTRRAVRHVTTFASMALAEAHRPHATRPGARGDGGLSVLRRDHHGAGEAWSTLQAGHNVARRSVPARLARRAGRRHALASVSRTSSSSAPSSACLATSASRRPSARASTSPNASSTRRDCSLFGSRVGARDARQAAPQLRRSAFVGRFRPRLDAARRPDHRTAAQTESTSREAIDQLHDYLGVDRTRRAAARWHRRRERRERLRHAQDRHGRDPSLPRRDELAGAHRSTSLQAAVMGLVGAAAASLLGRRASVRAAAACSPTSSRSTSRSASRRTAMLIGLARRRVGRAGLRAAPARRAAQRVAAPDAASRARRRRAASRALAIRSASSSRSRSRSASSALGLARANTLARDLASPSAIGGAIGTALS